MGGVPRSKGCQNCVQKDLKCDQTRPQCQRCVSRGVQCPGYVRVFRFQNEGPSLKQRYSPADALQDSSTASSAPVTSSRCTSRRGRRRDHGSLPSRPKPAEFKAIPLSMDEERSPSLAVRTVSAQQVQVFINYIMTAWPCLFKCTERRVSVNWVEFAAGRGSGAPGNPFDVGLRSTTCSFMGSLHGNQRLLNAGRYLHGETLRTLAGRLNDPDSSKADDVVAAAVTLSVYEMFFGATADSWLHHHAGIVQMMKLRGPRAHVDGFGRAIYIAYRGFFITAALLTGEACLLEQAEWQAMSEAIAADNAKQPDSSLFTDIAERAFREMTKLPGYVKRVRDLWNLPSNRQPLLRPQLLQEIIASRATLRGIHTEFSVTVATHGGPDNKNATMDDASRHKFVGPIPYTFFDGFSSLSIRGIRMGIVLLNELLTVLTPNPKTQHTLREEIRLLSPESKKTRRIAEVTDLARSSTPSTSSPLVPSSSTKPRAPSRQRPFPIRCESLMTPELRQGPTTPWIDSIATSYGMLGVRIKNIHDVP